MQRLIDSIVEKVDSAKSKYEFKQINCSVDPPSNEDGTYFIDLIVDSRWTVLMLKKQGPFIICDIENWKNGSQDLKFDDFDKFLSGIEKILN